MLGVFCLIEPGFFIYDKLFTTMHFNAATLEQSSFSIWNNTVVNKFHILCLHLAVQNICFQTIRNMFSSIISKSLSKYPSAITLLFFFECSIEIKIPVPRLTLKNFPICKCLIYDWILKLAIISLYAKRWFRFFISIYTAYMYT